MIEVLQIGLSWLITQLDTKPKTWATVFIGLVLVLVAGSASMLVLSTKHTLTKRELKQYKDTVRQLRVSLEGRNKVIKAYQASEKRYDSILKLRKEQATLSCKADEEKKKRAKLEVKIAANKKKLSQEKAKAKTLSDQIDKATDIDALLKIARKLEK